MSPQRIQLRRTPGWRKPEGCVSVARPSRWGNPFNAFHGSVYGLPWGMVRFNWCRAVYTWRDVAYSTHSSYEDAVLHAVDLFETLCAVSRRDDRYRFEKWIAPLRGHDLGCWCKPGAPCHADVLLRLAS